MADLEALRELYSRRLSRGPEARAAIEELASRYGISDEMTPPPPAKPPLPTGLTTGAERRQRLGLSEEEPSTMSTLGSILASPITGIAGIPGQLAEFAKGERKPSGGFLSDEPVTQAFGNTIAAVGASSKLQSPITREPVINRPSAGPGIVSRTLGRISPKYKLIDSMVRAVGDQGDQPYMSNKIRLRSPIAPADAPPPDWLNRLQGFTFDDMERKLRGQSSPSTPPSQPTPFDTVRKGGFGGTALGGGREPIQPVTTLLPGDPHYIPGEPTDVSGDPNWQFHRSVTHKQVGGFGGTSLGRTPPGPPVTTTLPGDPNYIGGEPTTIPPVQQAPAPWDTKQVGGFGGTNIGRTKGPIVPRVTEETPDITPNPNAPATVPPVIPPVAPPPDVTKFEGFGPSTSPPKYGSPEYIQQFRLEHPDLPLPKGITLAPPPTQPPPFNGGTIEAVPGTQPLPVGAGDIPPLHADPRYSEMGVKGGTTLANMSSEKDMRIANHLFKGLDKPMTPEEWMGMDQAERDKIATSLGYKQFGKGGRLGRQTPDEGVKDVHTALSRLWGRPGY